MKQERYVADQLDVAAGEPRDQPIAREPRDADDKTEHGRKHDADGGNDKRVDKADPKRATESRRAGRIGDQRLADIEAGGVIPKTESRGDVGAREVLRRVEHRGVSEAANDEDDRDLKRNAADAARVTRQVLGFLCHRPARCGTTGVESAAQRMGGPYCRPPLVHSALRPRTIFSGEPCPMLLSKLSP